MIHLASTLIQAFRNAKQSLFAEPYISTRPYRSFLPIITGVKPMKSQPTFNEFMRRQVPGYFESLPRNVTIPPVNGDFQDPLVLLLEDATLDELAFAIQALEADRHAICRRMYDLQDLYQLARKRGVLGATTLNDAFRNSAESSKEPS